MSFVERMNRLIAEVGGGTLEGTIEVDQVYAHYQHEDLTLSHTHGGEGKFLEHALYARYNVAYQEMADAVLEGLLTEVMIRNIEHIAGEAIGRTPMLPVKPLGPILRQSYHTSVEDDGVVIYDMPAEIPRLTQKEITKIHEANRLETELD